VEEPLGHFKTKHPHLPAFLFPKCLAKFNFFEIVDITPFLTALSMGITRIGPIPVQPCTGHYSSKLPVAKDITPHIL
jgi:hypothetical protein